jgi:hypothetical protein
VPVKIEPISTSEGRTRLWKPEIQFDGIFEGLGVQPQFAVLLRAHAMSLKVLPERVQKVIAIEIHRISDLILAHQDSYRPTKESENADGVGESIEAMKKGQAEIRHIVR